MNPPHGDPRLTAYALGELPAAEQPEIEALLDASPEALHEVEETRQMAAMLTEAFARDASETATPPCEPALAEALAEPPVAAEGAETLPDPGNLPEPIAVPAWRFGWRPWLAVAASVVLLAIAGAWFVGSNLKPDPTQRLAAGRQEPSLPPVPARGPTSPPAATPAAAVGPGGVSVTFLPQAETTTDPVPLDSFAATSGAELPGVPQRSPGHAMNPEVIVRYGLVPQQAPSGPVSTSSSLRSRYGLGPAPNQDNPPVPASELSPAAAPATTTLGLSPVVSGLSAENGQRELFRSYRAQLVTRQKELRAAYREVFKPEPSGRNPSYVDEGDNAFQSSLTQPLSTFGLDVDTGSYANVRRFLSAGVFPPRAAVRVEEMINYFPYRHPAPRGDDVFGVQTDVAACPWEPRHRLVRLALKARGVTGEPLVANLVFLVDVSGSMQPGERLPLLKQALRALVKRMAPADRVAIVTYASSAGLRLPSTSAEQKDRILEAIDSLEAGGSTNGEGGIREAYDVARRHFIPGGVNRVLLLTDGDFNVGMSDQDALVGMIEQQAKSGVFLTTLGVGTDNFKDALMRRLADRGNGSYHYLDSFEEAQRVLLEQREATFVTVARDAKAQVEFNPGRVAAWRLIGYEKRLMAAQDFNDDTKDAGEVGAGQTVTVLYEIVPAGERIPGAVDPLKYQPTASQERPASSAPSSPELLTLKLRYQRPEGSASVLKEFAVTDRVRDLSGDFQFATAVAAFGMTLRDPSWNGGRGFDMALSLAQESLGEDPGGWRAEFLTLVRKARGMPRQTYEAPAPGAGRRKWIN